MLRKNVILSIRLILFLFLMISASPAHADYLVAKQCEMENGGSAIVYLFPPNFTDRDSVSVRIKGFRGLGVANKKIGIFTIVTKEDEVIVNFDPASAKPCTVTGVRELKTSLIQLQLYFEEGKPSRLNSADSELVMSRIMEAIPAAILPRRINEKSGDDTIYGNVPDILFNAYGFQKWEVGGRGYINLLSGMRLRTEYSLFQQVYTPAVDQGYVGLGIGNYSVSRRADDQSISFEPFFGHLALLNALPEVTEIANRTEENQQKGAFSVQCVPVGGVIDVPQQYRYYGLLYPGQMKPGNGEGNPTIYKNEVLLIGADKLCSLRCALDNLKQSQGTNNVQISQNVCGQCTNQSSVVCTAFRGRAVVIPEIQVTVRGVPTIISVGTTLADVVRRELNLTPGELLKKVKLRRLYGGKYEGVNYRNFPEAMNLPLLKGDRIEW